MKLFCRNASESSAIKSVIASALNNDSEYPLTLSTITDEESAAKFDATKYPLAQLTNYGTKLPVLETEEGLLLWETNAILRYIAAGNEQLSGSTPFSSAKVSQWLDFTQTELDLPVRTILYSEDGLVSNLDPAAIKSAKGGLFSALKVLNISLESTTFLASDANKYPTLADVSVFGTLYGIYVRDPKILDKHINVKRWFNTVLAVPQFKSVIDSLPAYTPAVKKVQQEKQAQPKQEKKQEAKPAQAEKKAEKKAEAPAADATDAAASTGDNASEEEALKELRKKQKEEAKLAKMAKFQAKQNSKKAPEPKAKGEAAAKKVAKKEKPAAPAAPTVARKTVAKGEKKDMSTPMAPAYDPTEVEKDWYEWWEAQGFFKPENSNVGRDNTDNASDSPDNFVMVIPPPNVTGQLHLGHALTNSIQDTLSRWNRMSGKKVLWVPGTDHAGIATQVVVEKKLYKDEKITRHEIGREKFVEKVWEWKNEYGNTITSQLRRIGSSLDWSRETFTMDSKRSAAVNEAFVLLFDQKLIYRETRLVNWCCKLKSAISDIEVEHVELKGPTELRVPGYEEKQKFGIIENFVYQIAPLNPTDEPEFLEIGTTRLETMLGDTGVAVHPDDKRYSHLHGRYIIHPFQDRKIPIITDSELVEMEFGTGVVKVTPAHDPNDFKCGKKNNLEMINILDDEGLINANGAPFAGMKRFDARNAVRKELEKLGLYRGSKENPMSLGICTRTGDVIEGRLKPQWWVDCKDMAADAANAVRQGDLELIPSNHADTWFRWLDNIRDWCISRQLWWGHRIPAYLVIVDSKELPDERNNWVVARTKEEALQKAIEKFGGDNKTVELKQDEDVLDTWFSSGLFPFSVFGWPNQTQDLEKFFPTTFLETGHDILFFWVARMVMLGKKLTGHLPFKKVFLHGMVQDAHGRKMSKTLGNVIDPIDVIQGVSLQHLVDLLSKGNLDPREIAKATEGLKKDYPSGIQQCGTDALRFALCSYTSQGSHINLDVNRIVGYRNFCNKIWNAVKFALYTLGPDFVPNPTNEITGNESDTDKWILSKLNSAIQQSISGLKNYEFSSATTAIYSFWLYQLCDVYLEAIKPVFRDDGKLSAEDLQKRQKAARDTLYTCIETGLLLLHPFMPFVTEELFHTIPARPSATPRPETISLCKYPTEQAAWANEEVEGKMKIVQDVVHAIRSLRADYNITAQASALVRTGDDVKEILNASLDVVRVLSRSKDVGIIPRSGDAPLGCAVHIVREDIEVYLHVADIINIEAEIKKLAGKLSKLEGDLKALEKQMAVPGYEERVPEKVKTANSEKKITIQQEIETTKSATANFEKLRK
eukprot:TRINITY_DN12344_c0_g1_i1.p2 TRINITY_DN12344_c0_g1~~TRINITY_DN12344_c0_g1_i1.p2  ORF type:complete len:1330 (-),score=738.37 TRINITY_DN12344_c0_g1_i1:45-4034(-)